MNQYLITNIHTWFIFFTFYTLSFSVSGSNITFSHLSLLVPFSCDCQTSLLFDDLDSFSGAVIKYFVDCLSAATSLMFL